MELTPEQTDSKKAGKATNAGTSPSKPFVWTKLHTQIVSGVIGVVVVAFGAWALMSSIELSKEQELQGQLSAVLDGVNQQAQVFERGKNPPPPPKVAEGEKAPAPLPSAIASGDLEKDYGAHVKALSDFVNTHQDSTAGARAALRLAALFNEYKKFEEGLQVLRKVEKTPGMVGALVQMQIATQLMNTNNCPEAEKIWAGLGKGADAFLKAEIKLQQGLCAEAAKDVASAERLFEEARDLAGETAVGRSAEHYLRLLKFKGPQ